MVDAFRRRRALMVEGLSQVPGFKVNQPMGAFYVFPDVSALFGNRSSGKPSTTPTTWRSTCWKKPR